MKFKTESWKCESLMKINVRVILTVATCFVNLIACLISNVCFHFLDKRMYDKTCIS